MDRAVSTKIWQDDLEKLREIARENGITVSELLRMLIYEFLGEETRLKEELERIKLKSERKCRELKEVRGLLGRLSNYANQIAKALNRLAKEGKAEEREIEELRRTAGELLAVSLLVENWINERE